MASLYTFDILKLVTVVFAANVVLLFTYLKSSRHFHWFDKPDEARKLHSIAKPTSAGLVFMLPLLLFGLKYPQLQYFNTGLLVLLVLGGVDDFKAISVRLRLIVIFFVCGYFMYSLFYGSEKLNYSLMVIYLLGLIWWLNLYNFMDGVDGMTVLHAIVTTIGYIVAFGTLEHLGDVRSFDFSYALLFLFCLLSFLLFNFPKSRMFMGDSGSLSVAFVLAGFALYGLSENIFDEILIISFHLLFIVDTTLTLFTRMKFKHKLAEAHNLHLFQAMVFTGKSHAHVSAIYALITVILVVITLYLQFVQVDFLIRVSALFLEATVLSFLWVKFHNKTKFERFVK
ncbi:MAG: hypothetical protein JKX98_07645 [Alcanivoracaceae bacterium]|nr:hypothetical protein [Alcanivoracaceae bacterium]